MRVSAAVSAAAAGDPARSLETPRYIAIARIARPQGRRGEVTAETLTDFPERFRGLQRAWLGAPAGSLDEAPREVTVERAWPHKGRMILKLAGVDAIDEANRLRGFHVLVPREERVVLPDGSYYVWELEGCQVMKAGPRQSSCELVGAVTAVEPTGGVPLLHVARRGGGEVLVPLAQEICTRIDIAGKMIVVNPPDDLLDLNP